MTHLITPTRRGLLLGAGAAALAARTAHGAPGGVSATEFGLEPGGEADQGARLQRALETTASRDAPLFLPPGRYRLATTVAMPANARLVGVAGATRLVAEGAGPALSAAGARHVTLSGLVVDGAAASLADAPGLCHFRDVARLDVAQLDIEASRESGIHLEGCGGRIARSRVSGALGAGIFSIDGRDLDIADNEVVDCGNNAIQVWQSARREDGSRVTGNLVSRVRADGGGSGQNGNGVNVYRAGSVLVADNRITDCAFSAIRFNGADNAMVSRNRCSRLGEVALYVEFGFEGAVVADNLIDGAEHGISITNFNDGGRLAVVSGNLVRNIVSRERGTAISAEADTAITGNTIDTASHAGIALGWGSYLRDVAANGNVVRGCPIGIAVSVSDGAGGAAVTGNVVSGADRGAIVAMRRDEIVARDLQAAAADYPQLVVAGNRVS